MRTLRLVLVFVCVLPACGRPARDAKPIGDALAANRAAIDTARPPPLGADSGMLFAVEGSSGSELSLIPIAIVLHDSLIRPPSVERDSPDDPFVRRFLARNARYEVFIGGKVAGTLRLTKAEWTGCEGYQASAALEGPLGQPLDALAGHLARNPRAARRRVLSPAETAALDSLVLTILREHQVPVTSSRATSAPSAFAFALDTGNTMVLTGTYDYVLQPIDSGRTVSVSLIAEPSAHGWVVSWSHYAEGSPGEGSGGGVWPIDALDINGNGRAELVLARTGFEELSYLVLRRNASGWSIVYAGGGFGC